MRRNATLGHLAAATVAALVLLLPSTASAAAEWPLQGYWPLLEGRGQTIFDISGRGNRGRLGSTAGADTYDAQWVKGLLGIGHAPRLDGNDFVAIPDAASLRPQHVTVEAWVRAPKSPGRFAYVFVKGGDRCEAGSFGLYSSINGGMAFYVYDGRSWWRSPMVSTAVWDNAWHHVAGTYDGTAVRLYVDGWQIGAGTPFTGEIEYDLPVQQAYVGAYRGGCDRTFAGDVDEVRLWSAALPVGEIWNRITSMLKSEPAAPLREEAQEWYQGS